VPNKFHAYYFRLKTVDLDGAFEYSPIVYAEAPCPKAAAAILYPNPNFTSELTVEVNSQAFYYNVQMELSDNFGRILQNQIVSILEGTNKIIFDTHNLPTGIYFIKITGMKDYYVPLQFVKSKS
jgi:hypothetical protein